jgi:UDP-N-acetylglucosamine 1-carboxyvinyltransferase
MSVNTSNQVNNIRITGNSQLSGQIKTNSTKNSTVAIISAALLNHGKTTLHNVSRISDVHRLLDAAQSLGVELNWLDNKTLEIKTPDKLNIASVDRQSLLRGGRSTILFLGALSAQYDQFNWPHAGGCKMGQRTITAHRHSLQDLGIEITTTEDHYEIDATGRTSGETTLYESSDTATESVLLAAATLPGTTIINFAQANYMVQELCFFLEKLGVNIEGIGTSKLIITGQPNINVDVDYSLAEDPIESMMLIAAAAVTESNLTITHCPIEFLRRELIVLAAMGLEFDMQPEYKADNGRTSLVDITVAPSKLQAIHDKIHAVPYPGINSDNLPFFVPIATQADGLTLIHDWMWENRAIYFTELNRLGANVNLADPHRVFIEGPTPLRGAKVICPPALRPSMIILVAMLAADGVSELHSVAPINRGYENIFNRLNAIGANIEVID